MVLRPFGEKFQIIKICREDPNSASNCVFGFIEGIPYSKLRKYWLESLERVFSLISHVLCIAERQTLYQNDPIEVGRLLRVSTVVRSTAFASYEGISKDAPNKTAKSVEFIFEVKIIIFDLNDEIKITGNGKILLLIYVPYCIYIYIYIIY